MQTVHYCTTLGNGFFNKELNFTSTMNKTYRLNSNNDYLVKWGRDYQYFYSYHRVDYLRSTSEIISYFSNDDCASTLNVLAYMPIIGYEELIHLYREKDFVNKTTRVIIILILTVIEILRLYYFPAKIYNHKNFFQKQIFFFNFKTIRMQLYLFNIIQLF